MASPTTSSPELTIHTIFRTCTILQWNARGLRSKLSDFRQLVRAYQIPFIVISESRVGPHFRMNGYYFHHSKRPDNISRLLIGFRRDIPASEIDIPPHSDNEYVCAITLIGKQEYTLIGVYLEPGRPFDASRLENLISRTPSPHIICGDFNAHNEIWGSSHTCARGAKLAELLSKHSIEPLNDGSITYLRGTTSTSSIDVTFVTSSVARNFHWCTDLETRGSDHYPIMISAVGAKTSSRKLVTRFTDWDAYKDAASKGITAATKDDELLSTMAHCLRECTRVSSKNDRFPSNDEEFEKLCAIRRRAERKVLRTKCLEDLRACRRTQRHIRRYLDKRSWQRWRDFCSTLDVRQPVA